MELGVIDGVREASGGGNHPDLSGAPSRRKQAGQQRGDTEE